MKIKKFVLMICVISIIIVIMPLIIGDDQNMDTTESFSLNVWNTVTVNGCEGYYDVNNVLFEPVTVTFPQKYTVTEHNGNSKCTIEINEEWYDLDKLDSEEYNFYENGEYLEINYPDYLLMESKQYHSKQIVLTKDVINNKITLRYYHIGEEKTCKTPTIRAYGLCFDYNEEEKDAVVILVGCAETTALKGITCTCTAGIFANDANNVESYKQKVKNKFVNCDTINWVE